MDSKPNPSDAAASKRSPQRRSARYVDPLASQRRGLRVCEPRLALSASLAADLVLSSLSQAPDDVFDHAADPVTDGDWLLQQAAEVREQYGLDGAGQSIAVIDSGIAWDHVALGGGFGPGYRVVGGWDFVENDADPYDDAPAGFHGSHVSGLLAGQSEDFGGMATGADLISLRVFDDQGQGSLDAIESALQWVHENRLAYANPITTVNLSLGAILNDATETQVMGQLEDELQLLHDDGILVVAAAGNGFNADYPTRVTYPAESQWVTAVGSIDADGALSSFSQRQDGLLVAPGSQVRSTVPDHVLGWDGTVDDFATANGTSMAAPQIAGASALVRQAMLQVDPQADVDPDRILDHLRDTSITSVDSQTGISYHTVDLQTAIDSLLADTDVDPDPVLDSGLELPGDGIHLGTVQSQATVLEGDTWYELDTAHQGVLSLGASADVQLQIVDAAGNALEPLADFGSATGSAGLSETGGEVQYDYAVEQQQRLFVRIEGDAAESVRFTNLLQWTDGEVRILGTGASDSVRLDLTDSIRIEINGAQYQWATTDTQRAIHFSGSSGNDTLSFQGSSGSERISVYPASNVSVDTNRFTSQTVAVEFEGFENVRFDGGGGADQASLYDTPGSDQLTASPQFAQLSGVGYDFDIQQVPRIYVHATAGGEDTAFLYDSDDDDTLVVRPQFSSLRSQEHFNLAYGFERVYAFATAGGNDSAQLYDSAGNDRMTASAVSAGISGPGYFASARYFESVEANATAGGVDTAHLYASGTAAQWQQASGLVQMTDTDDEGRVSRQLARGFDSVATYADGQAVEFETQSRAEPVDVNEDDSVTDEQARRTLAALFAELGLDN
ncbi:S8 family peptidase [Roseimaritima ulvae]|uniref:Subtilisin BL n=1 Tax=Roseimaritima ulvae TaxID=980254 RepID=A0A5B9QXX7_9BACT|nr:S8 family serine peptidase [Roseimaritima ulvae]QEG41946.1 Subtilisin BL [Roseimaritima ulvae]